MAVELAVRRFVHPTALRGTSQAGMHWRGIGNSA